MTGDGRQVHGGGGAEARTVGAEDVCLANPLRLDGVPDMAGLSELSLPCLLHNLVLPLPLWPHHHSGQTALLLAPGVYRERGLST